MTYVKLFGYGLGLAAFLVVTKSVFYSFAAWETSFLIHALYWVVVGVAAVFAVRQLGAITVLEALIVLVLWLVLELLGDVLITGLLVGYKVLVDPNMAVGYVVLASAIIFFHHKRHIARRKELAA